MGDRETWVEVKPAASGVALRRAHAGDLSGLLGLLAQADLPTAGVAEWLGLFIVAERDGVLVGAAGLELYDAHALLRSVVVAPSLRGTGAGAALVQAILREARAAGARDVYLLTTTAEHWFPRFGFRRIGRDAVPSALEASVELREACPSSAGVLVLDLEGAPRSDSPR